MSPEQAKDALKVILRHMLELTTDARILRNESDHPGKGMCAQRLAVVYDYLELVLSDAGECPPSRYPRYQISELAKSLIEEPTDSEGDAAT